jgi:hypothetical protein
MAVVVNVQLVTNSFFPDHDLFGPGFCFSATAKPFRDAASQDVIAPVLIAR